MTKLATEWWASWWSQDFSWAGLATKTFDGWAVDTTTYALIPDEKVRQRNGYRPATLQDFWRDLEKVLVRSPDGAQAFSPIHLPLVWLDGSPTPKNVDHPENEKFAEVLRAAIATGWAQLGRLRGTLSGRRAPIDPVSTSLPLQGGVLIDFPYQENLSRPTYDIDASNCFVAAYFVGGRQDFGRLVFRDAFFQESCDFQGAIVKGHADFSNAHFQSGATFENVSFAKQCWFGEARFLASVSFRDSRFNDVASFDQARFDDCNFAKAVFDLSASFSEATFRGRASFLGSVFKDDAAFYKARFEDGCNFEDAEFVGEVEFADVRFKEDVSYVNAKFARKTSFERTRFEGVSKYQQAQLHEDTSFDGALFPSVDRRLFVAQLRFWVIAGVAVFSGSFSRSQTGWVSWVSIGLAALLACVAAYLAIRPAREPISDAQMRAFRTLTLASEKFRNRRDAARFYRLELKSARLRSSTPLVERWVSSMYDAFSEYGNSMLRPLVALVVVVLAFAALFWRWEAEVSPQVHQLSVVRSEADPDGGGRFAQALNYSLTRALPFFPGFDGGDADCAFEEGLLRSSAPERCGGTPLSREQIQWHRLLVGTLAALESVLVLVLAFLFGLAVRRRFQID